MIDYVLGLTIFWRLVLAHLLTDFTFQTNRMAAWKRQSVWGAFVHSSVFLVCGVVLCFPQLSTPWLLLVKVVPVSGWVVMIALTVLHFLEDEWRVITIRKNQNDDSFFFFFIDQLIHLVLIFMLVPSVSTGHPEIAVLLGIILILITHFSTIVLYYIEKVLSGTAQMATGEKYSGIAERLGIALTIMLPGWWSASCIIMWLIRPTVAAFHHTAPLLSVKHLAGNILALTLGILARLLIN